MIVHRLSFRCNIVICKLPQAIITKAVEATNIKYIKKNNNVVKSANLCRVAVLWKYSPWRAACWPFGERGKQTQAIPRGLMNRNKFPVWVNTILDLLAAFRYVWNEMRISLRAASAPVFHIRLDQYKREEI